MGAEETKVEERLHTEESLNEKIEEHLSKEGRLNLSHQANIWEVCHHLAQFYTKWRIT
jgi:sulfur relay (sulfurtransferase) DsrC/TusE family protein